MHFAHPEHGNGGKAGKFALVAGLHGVGRHEDGHVMGQAGEDDAFVIHHVDHADGDQGMQPCDEGEFAGFASVAVFQVSELHGGLLIVLLT